MARDPRRLCAIVSADVVGCHCQMRTGSAVRAYHTLRAVLGSRLHQALHSLVPQYRERRLPRHACIGSRDRRRHVPARRGGIDRECRRCRAGGHDDARGNAASAEFCSAASRPHRGWRRRRKCRGPVTACRRRRSLGSVSVAASGALAGVTVNVVVLVDAAVGRGNRRRRRHRDRRRRDAEVADVVPCRTVTAAGTDTALLALASATDAPPAGAAADSVTVPVAALPPTTESGLPRSAATATPARPAASSQAGSTSKSLAVSVENAGLRTSLFQRVSNVPRDVHVGAVVGDDQAVFLHRAEDLAARSDRWCATPGRGPSTLVFSRNRAPIGSAPGRRSGAMRRRIDVAVGRADRDTKRVTDVGDRGVPRLVVAHEAGEDREPGSIRRRPRVGPPIVRRSCRKTRPIPHTTSPAPCCSRRCRARTDSGSCNR